MAAGAGLPLVVLLDEVEQGRGGREHADSVGAAFDLCVEAFD